MKLTKFDIYNVRYELRIGIDVACYRIIDNSTTEY